MSIDMSTIYLRYMQLMKDGINDNKNLNGNRNALKTEKYNRNIIKVQIDTYYKYN